MYTMLYKLHNKKGNITIIIIGLISVMLIMTMTMSRRMSGHTQLLTLGDYTQISRYFLESYVGDVMQQLRATVNNPSLPFSKEICKAMGEEDAVNTKMRAKFYSQSSMLEDLADELGIVTSYEPVIEMLNPEVLSYPNGIEPGDEGCKEKRGLLQITVKCVFKKREYTLTVQYPFCVVYRMTPILKDFMLFADDIYEEQRQDVGLKDDLNLLYIENGQHVKNKTPRSAGVSGDVRPLVLMQAPDMQVTAANSGKVYLGPSNKSIYLNLAGEATNSEDEKQSQTDSSEMFLVSPDDLGVRSSTTGRLVKTGVFTDRNGEYVQLLGQEVKLKAGNANMGVMGFCSECMDVFEGTAYTAEEFLGKDSSKINGTYWGNVLAKGKSNLGEYLSYASGIKLFGLKSFDEDNDPIVVPREIYGNVFSRFFVLTFWYAGSAGGIPLVFDPDLPIDQVPVVKDYSTSDKHFEPLDSNEKYDVYMSRIMSGMNWEDNSIRNKENFFMPFNIDLELHRHQIRSDDEFKAADGFHLSNDFKLHDFGKTWFGIAKDESEEQSPIEKRIGRAFYNQDDFKAAVGLENPTKKSFMINGVVFVKGPLELDDMDLPADRCSGGIILVDGPITIGNITRGKAIDSSKFKFSDNSGVDIYKAWNNPAKPEFIGQDKMLTFVSLNNQPITICGNTVLGVQLISLNGKGYSSDQIKWDVSNKEEIIFYGSIACNRLNLPRRLEEFGECRSSDPSIDAPFFIYPPLMATSTPQLAVQIQENMRGYKLNSGKVGFGSDE